RRMKGDACHGTRRAAQRKESFPCRGIPNLHRPVLGTRRQALSIRAERDSEHCVRMVAEDTNLLAFRDVPKLYLVVVAAGGKEFPVWTERHGIDAVLVPGQSAKKLMVPRVP